jgi:hypothetical protein
LIDIGDTSINEKEYINIILQNVGSDEKVFVCVQSANVKVGDANIVRACGREGVCKGVGIKHTGELLESGVVYCRCDVAPEGMCRDVWGRRRYLCCVA